MPASQRLQDEALQALISLLLDAASAHTRIAYDLGVSRMEAELGREGLFDANALRFVQEFEYTAISSVSTEVAGDVRLVMLDAVRFGSPVRDIIRELDAVIDSKRARLKAIARTETNRAANWGRLNAANKSGVVHSKEWVATIDGRVRDDHLIADGETVPLNGTFTRGAAAGLQAPPAGVNCRCSWLPVTDFRLAVDAAGGAAARERRAERVRELQRERGVTLGQAHVCRVGLGEAVQEVIPGLIAAERDHEKALLSAWDQYRDAMAEAVEEAPRFLEVA